MDIINFPTHSYTFGYMSIYERRIEQKNTRLYFFSEVMWEITYYWVDFHSIKRGPFNSIRDTIKDYELYYGIINSNRKILYIDFKKKRKLL
jgi:hypothetical protein